AFTIDGPVAIRYPRGNGIGANRDKAEPVTVGKAELLQAGDDGLLITVGTRAEDAMRAAATLADSGTRYSVLNLRFIKPLDIDAIKAHLKPGKPLAIVEEGVAQGGIGEAIATLALSTGWQGPFVHIGMPDHFPEHGPQERILHDLALDADCITKTLKKLSGL
ncbi:MAG TPA: transketolase C-terminal domain-containing protein, partial [Mariprofundaceae bacterium]|nr:transketolase C-terminal domain-containing protein [Mariprofundaceae bacterium]